MIIDKNGKQLSPCICSHARYALRLKVTPSKSRKKCTMEYWGKTLEIIAEQLPKKARESRIKKAITMYEQIFK